MRSVGVQTKLAEQGEAADRSDRRDSVGTCPPSRGRASMVRGVAGRWVCGTLIPARVRSAPTRDMTPLSSLPAACRAPPSVGSAASLFYRLLLQLKSTARASPSLESIQMRYLSLTLYIACS